MGRERKSAIAQRGGHCKYLRHAEREAGSQAEFVICGLPTAFGFVKKSPRKFGKSRKGSYPCAAMKTDFCVTQTSAVPSLPLRRWRRGWLVKKVKNF